MVAQIKQLHSTATLEKEPEFTLADFGKAKLTLTPSGEIRFGAPDVDNMHVDEAVKYHDSAKYIDSVLAFLEQHGSSSSLRNEGDNLFLNLKELLKRNPGMADDVAAGLKSRIANEIFIPAYMGEGTLRSSNGHNGDVLALLVRHCGVKPSEVTLNKSDRLLQLSGNDVGKLNEIGLVSDNYFKQPDAKNLSLFTSTLATLTAANYNSRSN